jgi:hypothetical protein
MTPIFLLSIPTISYLFRLTVSLLNPSILRTDRQYNYVTRLASKRIASGSDMSNGPDRALAHCTGVWLPQTEPLRTAQVSGSLRQSPCALHRCLAPSDRALAHCTGVWLPQCCSSCCYWTEYLIYYITMLIMAVTLPVFIGLQQNVILSNYLCGFLQSLQAITDAVLHNTLQQLQLQNTLQQYSL